MEECVIALETVLSRMICTLDIGLMYYFPRFIPVIYLVSILSRMWPAIEKRCFLFSGGLVDVIIVIGGIVRYIFVLRDIFCRSRRAGLPSRSVLTMVAACVLSPFSLFVGYTGESIMREALVFYIAYCVSDTYHGVLYYPQYFTLLDGWLHHTATGVCMAYFLYNKNYRPGCLAFIVEIPTIFLSASRVWRDSRLVRLCRNVIFPPSFVICRIILLGVFTWHSFIAGEIPIHFLWIYTLFTFLNLYWFSIFSKKLLMR